MKPAVRSTLELVAIKFETVTVDDILGSRRYRTHVDARHVAMWLLRQKFGLSYPEIALAMGVKDPHSGAMHAVKRVENSVRLRAIGESLLFDRVPLIDLPAAE